MYLNLSITAMQVSLYTAEECDKIADNAALRYINDKSSGIYRRKCGKGFTYFDAQGKRITEKNTLERIAALAIPPAYQKVWICAYENGHIQAIGIDDKKRKQYIYHALWNTTRQEKKFNSLIEFGRCLPQIRKHIAAQLKKPLKLNKKQVLCAIISLLDTACVRIGTLKYAQENHSYGITTLRKKHLSLSRKKAILDFLGKNAQSWHIIIQDSRLIKLLKKCEEIPGYELFKYYNEQGVLQVVTSQEVNGYLQKLTHYPFTAKNFRTWIACREIFYRAIKKDYSATEIKAAIQEVAILLGHTPTICRKNYIDPEIIRWWEEGRLAKWREEVSLRQKDKLFLFWLEHREAFH